MRSHSKNYLPYLGAIVVLPLLAAPVFAPPDGGEKPAVVESSAGPITLPGNAVAPTSYDSGGPIQVQGIGIKNFGVVDGRIYRGEQPDRDDYSALATLGVKTIIDLRLEARPESKQLAEAAGLRYVNIPIDDHAQPTDADVATFLKTVEDPDSGSVYVHCAGGRHRTGSMVALYRMVRDGWTVDRAYEEMRAYDFYTRNGHKGFKTYVFDYFTRMQADPTSVPEAYTAPAAAAVAPPPPADPAVPSPSASPRSEGVADRAVGEIRLK